MRFRLFKKTPTVHLIKRKGGPPSPKALPANERKAWFRERKSILRLIVVVALLALTISPALSPDFLLTVIEYGKKPGLMSNYATSISLVGVGSAFIAMTYI